MITRKNYVILALIMLVVVLAYYAIIALCGFADHWGTLEKVLFFLITYVLSTGPMLTMLRFYVRMNTPKNG